MKTNRKWEEPLRLDLITNIFFWNIFLFCIYLSPLHTFPTVYLSAMHQKSINCWGRVFNKQLESDLKGVKQTKIFVHYLLQVSNPLAESISKCIHVSLSLLPRTLRFTRVPTGQTLQRFPERKSHRRWFLMSSCFVFKDDTKCEFSKHWTLGMILTMQTQEAPVSLPVLFS